MRHILNRVNNSGLASCTGIDDGKKCGDQETFSPIEKPCRHPVVLRNCQPFEVILGTMSQVGAHLTLALLQGFDFVCLLVSLLPRVANLASDPTSSGFQGL